MSKVKTTKKQVIEVTLFSILGLWRRLIQPTPFDRLQETTGQRQKINQKETSTPRIQLRRGHTPHQTQSHSTSQKSFQDLHGWINSQGSKTTCQGCQNWKWCLQKNQKTIIFRIQRRRSPKESCQGQISSSKGCCSKKESPIIQWRELWIIKASQGLKESCCSSQGCQEGRRVIVWRRKRGGSEASKEGRQIPNPKTRKVTHPGCQIPTSKAGRHQEESGGILFIRIRRRGSQEASCQKRPSRQIPTSKTRGPKEESSRKRRIIQRIISQASRQDPTKESC